MRKEIEKRMEEVMTMLLESSIKVAGGSARSTKAQKQALVRASQEANTLTQQIITVIRDLENSNRILAKQAIQHIESDLDAKFQLRNAHLCNK